MLKRVLGFTVFFLLVLTVWFQSEDLLLQFYVLFPALLLLLIFFTEDFYIKLFPVALSVIAAFYALYLVRAFSGEMILLGAAGAVFIVLFCFFRAIWQAQANSDNRDCQNLSRELGALQQKHQSRLESLHHLEKQVSGLLDLFEIARDFNDYLDFDGMAHILFHRVLPEFPFRFLKLTILEKGETAQRRIFVIQDDGVHESVEQGELEGIEKEWLELLKNSKKLLQTGSTLVFPLIGDGEVTALLQIDGSQPDDLAKFEVLAAYLALQVKKVQLYQTVKDLSIRDGLTGLLVRRHFQQRFEEEIRRSSHYGLPLAVLVLDIDHFKRYNDAYGHLAGDATLKQVSVLLRENLRKVDLLARYGGEEFAIVIPETKKAVALEIGERIRSSIARHNFKVYNDLTRVTVSIGIALFPDDMNNQAAGAEEASTAAAAKLIQNADQALYRAKEDGRNRVVLYQDL